MSDLDLRAIAIMLDEAHTEALLRREEALAAILDRMTCAAIAIHVGECDVPSRFEDLRTEYGF